MQPMIVGFVGGIVYAVGAAITFGGTLAHFSRKYPSIAEESYRDDVIFAVFMALIPPAWFVCAANTRLYRRGFLFARPIATPNPDGGRDEAI